MIKDRLKNAKTYFGISEELKKGFEWIEKNDLDNIEDGKYIIDGDNIYANVQTYETKDGALYEAHKKYIDIQYMINGEERIGVCDYSDCKTKEKYSEDKDIEFLEGYGHYETIKNGEFLVLFPQDAHQPSLNYKEKKRVKKVVVKVKI